MVVIKNRVTGEYWTSRAGIPHGSAKESWSLDLQKARLFVSDTTAHNSLISIIARLEYKFGDHNIPWKTRLEQYKRIATNSYAILPVIIKLQ